MRKQKINPAYVQAAMRNAVVEQLNDDEGYFAEIPGFDGVWANEDTVEATRAELASVLEGWAELGLERGHVLPVIDGIDPVGH